MEGEPHRGPSAAATPWGSSPVAKTLESFDRAYANRVMLVLAGIVMIVLYVEGMLTPSLPTIQSDFHVDTAQVSLVISAYAISGVAMSPVVGKLGDIYGKRKVLMGVMLAYAGAVSVTGFSPNFEFMVAARTVQGVGLTILPLGMSLVREEFPRELVPRAQGILSAMFGIGFAISLPIGSFVSQNYGWRVTYHSAIPFVLLLTVAVLFLIRESSYRRPNTRVDYVGAALLGGALAGVVGALSQGQSWGWKSPLTLGFAGVGLLLIAPFVVWEVRWTRQGREPIVDPRLLRERNVAVTNAVLTVAGLGMYMALFALIYRFEFPAVSGGFSQNILQAGIDIVPLALSMMGVAIVASIAVSRVGVKPLALGGALVTSLGFVLLASAQTLEQSLLYETVTGAGIALLNASIINMLVLTVDPKDMGQATAMNNVFRNLGGSLGAPIVGSLLAAYVTGIIIPSGPLAGTNLPRLEAFQYAFWIAAIVTLIGGVAVLFGEEVLGPRRHPKFTHLPQLRGRERSPGPVPEPRSPAVPTALRVQSGTGERKGRRPGATSSTSRATASSG
ncbi:MAG: MFS transporter [Thermoplasmata archaeon]|nr:MFS transporter [Thermoplasmata archaeon]